MKFALALLLLPLLPLLGVAAGAAGAAVRADSLALNFHLMHPGGASAPGDPNAAFYLDGTYHVHYILAHEWTVKGKTKKSFSFVHVTSPDLLHWTWQRTKTWTLVGDFLARELADVVIGEDISCGNFFPYLEARRNRVWALHAK